ncbi:MAG: glycoside hydrolase family 15 protein [Jatrophihabitans sp.]|nr:MAG: glycoside hydrolase family 15 protein [Jatrophihabitans sp.]
MLIEDYALLGDLHTAALVGRNGAIDWLCLPRFDSPACFAALVGDADAGLFRLAPAAVWETDVGATRRAYRGDALVLDSEWDTPDGAVRVSDLMPPRGSSPDSAPDLVRIVEGVRGRVPMRMELRVRFDYGHIVPWVRRVHGQTCFVAGPDSLWLTTAVRTEGAEVDGALTTRARFEVAAGERVAFVLTYAPSYGPAPRPVHPHAALAATEAFWNDWLRRFSFAAPAGHEHWTAAVRRSLVLLKALTHAPTGGIVAAATTSLPEQLGGPRNWDYRYCWLRDATMTLQALIGTGYTAEAKAWREWLLRAVAGDPADLQIMYGIDGTRRLTEFELGWLAGYAGSTPVRVGNAASGQFQLDVWGEVLDGLHLAREHGIAHETSAWDVQRALLDHLESHWSDPDNGLWEIRGPQRHFVHSKVMAWAGIDRAVQAVERFGLDGPVQRWRALRAQIHAEVCERGYDAGRTTFTQFYGSTGLDAALLQIPAVGFLPWDDPRVVGTVEAVQRELDHDGFLLRYDPTADGGVDGLPGGEGAFLACTFWLADALHGIGRAGEAERIFERLLDLRNDVGILSEEWDAVDKRQLGNTPQAFSHVGLVNTARRLSGC